MNIFKSKKKDEPLAPAQKTSSPPSPTSATRQRTSHHQYQQQQPPQQQPSQAQAQGQGQGQGQPLRQPKQRAPSINGQSQGQPHNPRASNSNLSDSLQQQQQQPSTTQQQQYLHGRDPESGSLKSSVLGHGGASGAQPPSQGPSPYKDDGAFKSQPIAFSNGTGSGGNGSTGAEDKEGVYLNSNNSLNALTTAAMNLSGLGATQPGAGPETGNSSNGSIEVIDNNNAGFLPNIHEHGAGDGSHGQGAGPGGAGVGGGNNNASGGGGGPGSTTDIRKLQDELANWRKLQEQAQETIQSLRIKLTQTSQENRELNAGLNQVSSDRLMLQEMVHKRDKEMDELRTKYLNDVRQIRATDDDHSTIEQRVRVLTAAILQLTKSAAGDRSININEEPTIRMVRKEFKFKNTERHVLNMFVEKFVMDLLLKYVFVRPFYVGFVLADQYKELHDWMLSHEFPEQAVRFRQQLCFMAAKAPVVQEEAVSSAQEIAKVINNYLAKYYINFNGNAKVQDLVSKAIELSLTMRGQQAEIKACSVEPGSEFDAERMIHAPRSKEGKKVLICIIPCFVDTNGVVVGKAKVVCG